ncbi:Methyltransferase domain-containing protein [Sphingobium sp. AP50]|nr:Methyltransferase domain-containing protein [Sphingobium sp. AP50]
MNFIKKIFKQRHDTSSVTQTPAPLAAPLPPSADLVTPYQRNPLLFPRNISHPVETNNQFFTRFCLWADANDFNTAEFLLPQIQLKNELEPFLFEREFAAQGKVGPTQQQIAHHAPWEYQVEWGDVSTMGVRRDNEWPFHRHRGSMFPPLAAKLAGVEKSALTVMDVACHCGVIALEFARHGFRHVLGLDLRKKNIDQANFLKSTFEIDNVDFKIENARNLKGYKADVVFCGGLLYHVTFPVELLADLFDATGKFLIFDSLCQKHPFSGFHIYGGRDVNNSLEGDNAIELVPTYRAIIDLLRAAGFVEIYEILGSAAEDVYIYRDRNIRSFLAVKPGVTLDMQDVQVISPV